MQFIMWLDDTGRIRVYDLIIFPVYDTKDPVPCGLRLGRDNGKLLPGKEIHEGGLPYVGMADDVNEA